MSSSEVKYISVAVACMKASNLRILEYDLRFLGCQSYDGDNLKYEPSKIIVDNEATISMCGVFVRKMSSSFSIVKHNTNKLLHNDWN